MTFRFLRPYWPQMALAALVALLPALAQAWLPAGVVKPLFDEVLAKGQFERLGSLLWVGLGLMALLVVGGYAQEAFMGYLSVRLPRDLRERLLAHLTRVDLAALEGSPGAISGRIMADLRELESFIFFGLGTLLVQGLTLIALVGQLLGRYLDLTLYLLIAIPLMALVLGGVGRFVGGASRATQAATERLAGRLSESLGRLELLRALGLAGLIGQRFGGVSRKHYGLALRRALVSALYLPISQLATFVLLGVLLFLGVSRVQAGTLTTGDLTAFMTLLALAITPLQTLSRAGIQLAQADGAAGRLHELLALPLAQSGGVLKPERVEGAIEFSAVSFAYPRGEPVLQGTGFQIPPGSFTGLVGPSGVGKSSVIRLVLGLYRPQAGQVLLDGQDLNSYNLEALSHHLAWVPQEPLLLGGTVRENLAALAPNASEAEMQAVLQEIRLHDELNLDTLLEEEGQGLSVGQRQRLVLAGALLRKAAVLLLDEVTSALDPINEAKVLEAIAAVRKGRTLVVVAHRLSTVQGADQILVLSGGRVVESGRHEELVEKGGVYSGLWRNVSR
jgi:ATP-binding cassette subfamily B protein